MWSFRKEAHKLNNITFIQNPPCRFGMDVSFLIDYTGSMGPVIEEVKASAASIATAIEQQSSPNTYRLSLVISDEEGGAASYSGSTLYNSLPFSQRSVISGSSTNIYTTAIEVFSQLNNETNFINAINSINTSAFPLGTGEGDPEPLDVSLDLMINQNFVNSLRFNVARYILIFTDTVPGGTNDSSDSQDQNEINRLTQDCIDKGIKVFVLGAGASEPIWQNMAIATGGNFNTSFDGSVIVTQIIATCNNLLPPNSVAGNNQEVIFPANSITLNGNFSSDSDGTISSYLWEKVSGPSANITSPNSPVTNVNNLQLGDYVFRLTVIDNDGLTDTDFVTVNVRSNPVIQNIVFPSGNCCQSTP